LKQTKSHGAGALVGRGKNVSIVFFYITLLVFQSMSEKYKNLKVKELQGE
jgi:hypothetical protein